ncbi:hypothetical protein D9M68_975640 [compost metagenome]
MSPVRPSASRLARAEAARTMLRHSADSRSANSFWWTRGVVRKCWKNSRLPPPYTRPLRLGCMPSGAKRTSPTARSTVPATDVRYSLGWTTSTEAISAM